MVFFFVTTGTLARPPARARALPRPKRSDGRRHRRVRRRRLVVLHPRRQAGHVRRRRRGGEGAPQRAA